MHRKKIRFRFYCKYMKINNLKNHLHNYISFNKTNKYYHIGNSCLDKIPDQINSATIKNIPLPLKLLLRYFSPTRIKEMAQINLYAANKVKSYFDNLYGTNNYTLIAVGRSVASIAEVSKALGSDVKIIPLSGLRNGLPKNIPNTDIYKKYLDSIGINKNNFAGKKKPILIDYTYSGNSLEAAQSFLEHNYLTFNKEKLTCFSINNLLKDEFFNNGWDLLFSLNRFKLYSMVGKLNIDNLKNVFTQANANTAEEYKSRAARYIRKLFLFHVFDKLSSNKFEYVKPDKELDMLNKHYLSQKAMKVQIELFIKSQNRYLEQ